MTLPPRVVLLYIPFVCASLPSLNDTIIHTLDASDCPSCNTRTLWDILLSCGLTLFACTWTAIHPNIPGMDDGKFTVASRRLFVMAMAMIAPELMVTWAAAQFFSARNVAKEFNTFHARLSQTHGDHENILESTATSLGQITESGLSPSAPRPAEFREWTTTHGFFAWMGGFMLYVNGERRATLTPHELLRFVHDKSVDMPVIAKEDIEDRSKGDTLSKGVAVFQLLWFVLQFVARCAQNLPTTLLEIDTLAVTALTCIAYCLWFKKPKDIGRPYIVHWKATALPPSNLTYEYVVNSIV
ncbi:hypothetical protein EDB19DRAFT_1908159 [Suillus lakei]|nr:hypothetical protein EDB19DRAFT_1908159 [Suillus lakei]